MMLVIGYGNPLRCDDGLGQYLAEWLEERWKRAMFITSTQLTPELAEPISRAERVVFLDARVGDIPGMVTCENVQPLPANGAFTHNVTPSSLLAAAHELYGASPLAILITVTAASFEFTSEFSPLIRARLPRITDSVASLVDAFWVA
jgi:hydrogenase maturation protease